MGTERQQGWEASENCREAAGARKGSQTIGRISGGEIVVWDCRLNGSSYGKIRGNQQLPGLGRNKEREQVAPSGGNKAKDSRQQLLGQVRESQLQVRRKGDTRMRRSRLQKPEKHIQSVEYPHGGQRRPAPRDTTAQDCRQKWRYNSVVGLLGVAVPTGSKR